MRSITGQAAYFADPSVCLLCGYVDMVEGGLSYTDCRIN